MKKILILGASYSQIPLIEKARELGLYVITCDNTPSNPGHALADESHEVNTVDREAVLALAKRIGIDGVAYASDLTGPTAAWVCESLGLPTHPYESVVTLTNKGRFREFLEKNGFRTPRSCTLTPDQAHLAAECGLRYPLVVKPVDSSASRGVSTVEHPSQLEIAVGEALQFSRSGPIILEEFVESIGPAMTGDGFSVDGKLAFRLYTNDVRDPIAPLYAICCTVPLDHPPETVAAIDAEIQRAFDLLKLRNGPYNFDVRIAPDGVPILMEIAPRPGGGWIPHLAKTSTGVDMIAATVLSAVGEPFESIHQIDPEGYWATYDLSCLEAGTFQGCEFDPEFEKDNLVDHFLKVHPGDSVQAFTGAAGVIGESLLRFDSKEEMERKITGIRSLIRMIVA
ncbi:MAG: ATP-grasp domain-containing protein [Fibrobacteria bacterium]|nr:ATP-grasp domain-containing protein [Fibrobacteria bacterium]